MTSNAAPKESGIANKLHRVRFIESQMNSAQVNDHVFTYGQQRVLELEDGDSFLLLTIPAEEDNSDLPRSLYRSALQVAALLTSWAREHHVLIAFSMIDKDTARIWRRGTI